VGRALLVGSALGAVCGVQVIVSVTILTESDFYRICLIVLSFGSHTPAAGDAGRRRDHAAHLRLRHGGPGFKDCPEALSLRAQCFCTLFVERAALPRRQCTYIRDRLFWIYPHFIVLVIPTFLLVSAAGYYLIQMERLLSAYYLQYHGTGGK
jgi:hypothetical protein